jgi:hypothetical protein
MPSAARAGSMRVRSPSGSGCAVSSCRPGPGSFRRRASPPRVRASRSRGLSSPSRPSARVCARASASGREGRREAAGAGNRDAGGARQPFRGPALRRAVARDHRPLRSAHGSGLERGASGALRPRPRRSPHRDRDPAPARGRAGTRPPLRDRPAPSPRGGVAGGRRSCESGCGPGRPVRSGAHERFRRRPMAPCPVLPRESLRPDKLSRAPRITEYPRRPS